jgi:hypothetical protein
MHLTAFIYVPPAVFLDGPWVVLRCYKILCFVLLEIRIRC